MHGEVTSYFLAAILSLIFSELEIKDEIAAASNLGLIDFDSSFSTFDSSSSSRLESDESSSLNESFSSSLTPLGFSTSSSSFSRESSLKSASSSSSSSSSIGIEPFAMLLPRLSSLERLSFYFSGLFC